MIGFGRFGKRKLGIVSTEDKRLVFIDPTSEGFFDNVLGYITDREDIRDFQEAVKEVKAEKIGPFWKPIYDPSLDDIGEVRFKAERRPEVGHPYNFWKQKAEEMSSVEGYTWKLGTEYQYYAFLVWLVNRLVNEGQCIAYAMRHVILDSGDLGIYGNGRKKYLKTTGTGKVCEIYDLANTYKILECSNGGYWVASGDCTTRSEDCPLATLEHREDVEEEFEYAVGWLVLV